MARGLARTPELLERYGAAGRRRAQELTREQGAAVRGSASVPRLPGALN